MSFSRNCDFLATNEERERAARLREPNIPRQYPAIRAWSPGANVANIISVVQTGVGVEGPSRTILPQAQLPMAEQPQRTKEEPYLSSFLGQMVRSFQDLVPLTRRERLTFSRPAAPYEAWTPGLIGDAPEMAVLDDASVEMSRRRKKINVSPPIATQRAFPILSELRTRFRRT